MALPVDVHAPVGVVGDGEIGAVMDAAGFGSQAGGAGDEGGDLEHVLEFPAGGIGDRAGAEAGLCVDQLTVHPASLERLVAGLADPAGGQGSNGRWPAVEPGVGSWA